jgi:uncharacterized membrane protein
MSAAADTLIQTGICVLLLTPALRLATVAWGHARKRQIKYFIVSLLCTVMLVSLFVIKL